MKLFSKIILLYAIIHYIFVISILFAIINFISIGIKF